MSALSERDQDEDRPCRFCKQPLWRIHPDADPVLQWGHVSREDAYHCTPSRRPGIWPTPSPLAE